MNYSLSYLMGASNVSDVELMKAGAQIIETDGDVRKLRIPHESRGSYVKLITDKLDNGFWNEIVNDKEIHFIFKHQDGEVEEYHYSDETRPIIARLCSQFNGDPYEKTSELLQYLADNDFYAEVVKKYYL